MLDEFTKPVDIAKLFYTPFIRFVNFTRVHLNFLTTQEAYHAQLIADYLESVVVFIRQS